MTSDCKEKFIPVDLYSYQPTVFRAWFDDLVPDADDIDLRTLAVDDISLRWRSMLETKLELLVGSIVERFDVPIQWSTREHALSRLVFAKAETRKAVTAALEADGDLRLDSTSKLNLIPNFNIASTINYLRQLRRIQPQTLVPRALLPYLIFDARIILSIYFPKAVANIAAITLDDLAQLPEALQTNAQAAVERITKNVINFSDIQLPILTSEELSTVLK